MQIDLTHDRPVAVRVAGDLLGAVPKGDAQFVIEITGSARYGTFKETVAMNFLHLDGRLFVRDDVDLFRVGAKHADANILSDPVRSQNAEGIPVRAGKKTV